MGERRALEMSAAVMESAIKLIKKCGLALSAMMRSLLDEVLGLAVEYVISGWRKSWVRYCKKVIKWTRTCCCLEIFSLLRSRMKISNGNNSPKTRLGWSSRETVVVKVWAGVCSCWCGCCWGWRGLLLLVAGILLVISYVVVLVKVVMGSAAI